jgi:hydroxymethylglutaryl-CoA reductase (NADPH)
MRALHRPVARLAASSPIESIVFFFIVVTLAYFNVLSAIKHSSFLASNAQSPPRPAHAQLRQDEWVAISESSWLKARAQLDDEVTAVELQQIIISLDTKASKKVSASY